MKSGITASITLARFVVLKRDREREKSFSKAYLNNIINIGASHSTLTYDGGSSEPRVDFVLARQKIEPASPAHGYLHFKWAFLSRICLLAMSRLRFVLIFSLFISIHLSLAALPESEIEAMSKFCSAIPNPQMSNCSEAFLATADICSFRNTLQIYCQNNSTIINMCASSQCPLCFTIHTALERVSVLTCVCPCTLQPSTSLTKSHLKYYGRQSSSPGSER